MEIEYKKDLRHNYMVITEKDNCEIEKYGVKMLEHQLIEGILPIEHRRMDSLTLFYYDITAKQSMTAIFDKTTLSYDKVKQLCIGIISILENAYEYLLPEEDFILAPEHIYLEITSGKPNLCFLPGYHKSIKEQMSSLIEYLMNKVNYSDKEAVLLIYQLYATSREEGYTFDHLLEVLQNKKDNTDRGDKEKAKTTCNNIERASCQGSYNESHENEVKASNRKTEYRNEIKFKKEKETVMSKSVTDGHIKDGHIKYAKDSQVKDNRVQADNRMPAMMEKLEGEEEIPCYAGKTYVYTGLCIMGGILIILLSLASKIAFNSFGNRIDYSKLFALILIVLCVEGYLLKLIWNRKNMITKIKPKSEYIDPRPGREPLKSKTLKNTVTTEMRRTGISGRIEGKQAWVLGRQEEQVPAGILSKKEGRQVCEEEDNPTCILNSIEETPDSKNNKDSLSDYAAKDSNTLVLKPIEEVGYQNIMITDLPFFIGKLKKNVDFCLEKDVVSRYHAKITKEKDQYYITDLNSTNGTFVNQEAVQTYQRLKINIGDEIAFANIKYQLVHQM